MPDRYEINHDGQIVIGNAKLCSDQTKMLEDLFSQYGWSCNEEAKEGTCHKLVLTHANGNTKKINVYSGTIRNESRNPYEKKIQLNGSDPRNKSKEDTIILGIYVYEADDSYRDAVFVGYPIDENIHYDGNPSIRGTFVNKLLIQAKTSGFVYDNEHNSVGFRAEFIYYYLDNYYSIHYENYIVPKMEDTIAEKEEQIDPKEQRQRFHAWMKSQLKADGEPYSHNTITSYISTMEKGYAEFEKYHDFESVFQIQDEDSLKEYMDYLFNAEGFKAFNKRVGNLSCSNGLVKYRQFLSEENTSFSELVFNTEFKSDKAHNWIIFGAPGTGKSFMLNKERKKLLGEDNMTDYERVTFHPDYSYANFVGTYKPVPYIDSDGNDAITYEYVPGPFMRVLVKALKNGRTKNVKPYLLIIEEINRANVAAVFGDVFQLLDRDEDSVSEYPIQASEDMKKYLAQKLGGKPDDYSQIMLPNNMFIWATMNSADQGVFPIDTAFKRRWDFTYIGIDDNDQDIRGKMVVLGSKKSQKIEWNKLRKAINNFLAKQKINEDKQLGPYFIARSIVVPESGNDIDKDKFVATFKNKVIMYLFEDAARQKRSSLFQGCFENSSRYSEICREFDEKGIGIFHNEIQQEAEPEDLPDQIAETGASE